MQLRGRFAVMLTAIVACVTVWNLARPALADTLMLEGSSNDLAASGAEGHGLSFSAPIHLIFPVNGTASITSTDQLSIATLGYNLSDTQFNFTFTGSRNGAVSPVTGGAYVLWSGSDRFQVSDQGTSGFGNNLLYGSDQQSQHTPNESLTLGGSSGEFNGLTDTQPHNLIAGHAYKLFYKMQSSADVADAGATVDGSLTLDIGPAEVQSAPLPSAAWAGLALLSAVGGAQWLRRRNHCPLLVASCW